MANEPAGDAPLKTGRTHSGPAVRRSWKQWFNAGVLPRVVRFGLLAAIAGLLHTAGQQPPAPDNISLDSAKIFFPTAAELASGDARLGGQAVLDGQGKQLGLLLTTSPHADDLIGYSGPSNLLIALDLEQRVIGVHVLSSGDTPSHVEHICAQRSFWLPFVGTDVTTRPEKIDAVSGSTLTSITFAEAIDRRLRGTSLSFRFPDALRLREIRKLFKAAKKFEPDVPRAGWNKILDEEGTLLGYVVRTSPFSDNARGYQGPTESLVAVDASGQNVVGTLIRKSYDTDSYVDRVRDNDDFRDKLVGRSIGDWATIDFAREGIEGVSGATQTSFAIADGIRKRLAADVGSAKEKKTKTWNIQPGLLAVLGGGLALTFTPLRSSRRLRLVWQALLIVMFGWWLGDLLSIALLVGWTRHGIPWRAAPTVVLFAAVALLVPWATRRQIYCQQLCPHGAAQNFLSRFNRVHVKLSPNWQRWLSVVRSVLLAICVLLAVFAVNFDLAKLEPFDGWALKGVVTISAAIAVVGLIASVFVPQAYCRFGCPTGELLRLVKSGGSQDRLQRRDIFAGALVLIAAMGFFAPTLWNVIRPRAAVDTSTAEPKFIALGGQAFGTTWTVKVRGEHAMAPLQQAIAAELERIESTLSHWRPDSSTAQFNSSETTLETEQPAELVALVARALELSKLSDGRYDITVAQLVASWGFGPAGERATPGDAEIANLLERTGWQKLVADTQANTLRKKNPQLQIDLGSLLQGYAADQAKKILDAAGVTEYLIDIGGELLARGSWRVGVENPKDASQPLRTLTLKDAALATSGLYRAKKPPKGDTVHHLISPRTGRPFVTTTTLCAVSAPTAMEADAWATVLLAAGLPDAIPIADQQQLPVLLIDEVKGVQTNALGETFFQAR